MDQVDFEALKQILWSRKTPKSLDLSSELENKKNLLRAEKQLFGQKKTFWADCESFFWVRNFEASSDLQGLGEM